MNTNRIKMFPLITMLLLGLLAINQTRLQIQVNKLQTQIEEQDGMLEQLGDAVALLELKGGN